jgi:uroporphyrinogen-III synthase
MKRILITRPQSQADGFAKSLLEAGFEPVFFPVIEIHPIEDTSALDNALRGITYYDWVVFTSVNGVEIFWKRLGALQIKDFPSSVQIAAIGPKTANVLEKQGAKIAFVPSEFVAEAILPGLGELNDRWVLLPRAEIARKALPQAIAAAGGIAHEIAVYRTLPAQIDSRGLESLQMGVDVITFTSPSTVQNFVTLVENAGLNPLKLPGQPLVACIGPITASAARAEGIPVDMVSHSYTTEGLVELLKTEISL